MAPGGAIFIFERINNMQFTGTFKPHPKGFGFVQTVEGLGIFVAPKLAKRFFHFDVVQAEAEQAEDERWSAQSLTLVEPGMRRIAGTIERHDDALWVVPELSMLPKFPVYAGETMPATHGDKVVAEALATPAGWAMELKANIGPATGKNWESEIGIALHGIPTDNWVAPVKQADLSGYADMQHLPMVTIDSESTTDVDDAVFVEETSNGFTLYVGIADASSYVEEGSDLDKYAFERATTVYFAQQIHSMLPRSISSKAGSLLPDEPRPVLLAQVNISKQGEFQSVDVKKAMIRSRAKLSYTEVTNAVEHRGIDDAHPQQSTIDALHQLYLVLLERRVARGSLPIRSGDYDYELNENGRPVSIEFSPWHVSYGMIEECMLAANTGVAQWLIDRNIPCLYRHHKGPDDAAWATSRAYLESLGLGDIAVAPTPLQLQRLVESASSIGEEFGVSNAIRSAMRPATYQVDRPAHFSLAYDCYTHFTSPLRRYADMTVHRVVKRVLDGLTPYTAEELEPVAAQCTMADKRAKKSTREEAKRLRVEFAEQFAGQTIKMQVTGGNSSGWFVKSEMPPLEAFAVVSPRSGWTWDALTQRAVHEEKDAVRLGQEVDVLIQGIDLNKVRINSVPTCAMAPAPTESVAQTPENRP